MRNFTYPFPNGKRPKISMSHLLKRHDVMVWWISCGGIENGIEFLTFQALLAIYPCVLFDHRPEVSCSEDSYCHGPRTWIHSTNSSVEFGQDIVGLHAIQTLQQGRRELSLKKLAAHNRVGGSLPPYLLCLYLVPEQRVMDQKV